MRKMIYLSNISVEWKSLRKFSTAASVTSSSLLAFWLYFFALVEPPAAVEMMIGLVVRSGEQIVILTGVLNLYTGNSTVSRLKYPS